ncbi:MAG: hypothetical protein AAGI28_07035 [Pseudomonadota bacterium]
MNGQSAFARSLTLGGFFLALGTSAVGLAQESPEEVPREEAAFVSQAPEDASSKVYFPDAITPESVAAARARAARQQQIEAAALAERDAELAQVSVTGEGNEVAQLSDGSSTAALAQLSAAEQRVLLDAVEGTDICERGTDIPALQALCETRLETRSEEFAQEEETGSAEDRLLGGGLDASRVATLEAAIARLARAQANPANFDNQVVASVALSNQTLNDAQATATEGDPTAELSQETQSLVAAIIQQLGGGN